jgi:hypothetical protein
MFKKLILFIVSSVLVASLAACSAFSLGASASTASQLAAGIISLEGTGQAVTAAQAAELLPLWQAVKSLSTSDTVSSAEMAAVYDQILSVLTSDQVQAITSLTSSDSAAILSQYAAQSEASSSSQAGASSSASQSAASDPMAGAGDGSDLTGAVSSSITTTTSLTTSSGTLRSSANVLLASEVISILISRSSAA